jgi:hypothetical protein
MPEFVVAVSDIMDHDAGGSDEPATPQWRLAEGVSAESVNWPNLGYADAYSRSYEVFLALQEDGTIPSEQRYQIQYPTPFASTAVTFVPEDMPAVTASYEAALFADFDRAVGTIPHERLAVQWDVCTEVVVLEGDYGPNVTVDDIAPGLARCVDRVPTDVPVGLHLCYGDYGHRHAVQPESIALQVRLLNAVAAAANRPIDWTSFTVPQNRSDESYFTALRELTVGPETVPYFGIVPYFPADQAEGATEEQVRAIDASLATSPSGAAREWGISTECGMGRVADDDVLELLDLHRKILEAQRQQA